MFEFLKYGAVFLAVLVEGPVSMMVSGFLLHLGQVKFWPVYLALLLGDLMGDTLWYWLGRNYASTLVKKYGRFLGLKEDLLKTIELAFKKHDSKILLFSKLTMGFGFALPVLVAAGAARVSYLKFIFLNIHQVKSRFRSGKYKLVFLAQPSYTGYLCLGQKK